MLKGFSRGGNIKMTSEEMKLVKFETIITDLWKKFNSFKGEETSNKNPLKYLFGEKSNNKYAQIILDKSFNEEVASKQAKLNCTYKWKNDTAKELIDACRECNTNCRLNVVRKCNLSRQLIFFALIFVATDNDDYNEKINVISDMAYLIGFDAEMMKDWIYAVKTVLGDEKINFNKFKTEEAKDFFLVLL